MSGFSINVRLVSRKPRARLIEKLAESRGFRYNVSVMAQTTPMRNIARRAHHTAAPLRDELVSAAIYEYRDTST